MLVNADRTDYRAWANLAYNDHLARLSNLLALGLQDCRKIILGPLDLFVLHF